MTTDDRQQPGNAPSGAPSGASARMRGLRATAHAQTADYLDMVVAMLERNHEASLGRLAARLAAIEARLAGGAEVGQEARLEARIARLEAHEDYKLTRSALIRALRQRGLLDDADQVDRLPEGDGRPESTGGP